jgi:hypothetical protein
VLSQVPSAFNATIFVQLDTLSCGDAGSRWDMPLVTKPQSDGSFVFGDTTLVDFAHGLRCRAVCPEDAIPEDSTTCTDGRWVGQPRCLSTNEAIQDANTTEAIINVLEFASPDELDASLLMELSDMAQQRSDSTCGLLRDSEESQWLIARSMLRAQTPASDSIRKWVRPGQENVALVHATAGIPLSIEVRDQLSQTDQAVAIPAAFSSDLGSATKIDVGVFTHPRTSAQCPSLRWVGKSTAARAHELLAAQGALPKAFESRMAFTTQFNAPLSGMLSVELRKSFDVDTEPGKIGALQSVLVGLDTPLEFQMAFDVDDAARFDGVSFAAGRRLLDSSNDVIPCGETRETIQPTVFHFDTGLQQWEADSCVTTLDASQSGQVSARCTSSGTFSVRLAVRPQMGDTCPAKTISGQSIALSLLFVIAAGLGVVQIVRVTKANGKCKMSLIVLAHSLEIVTALLFGIVTLLHDLYAQSRVLSVLRLAAFVGLGGLLSAMLYVWNSIYHFAMKTRGLAEQKLAKKRLQVVNGLSVLAFAAATVLSMADVATVAVASMIAVAPISVFGLWQLVATSRMVGRVNSQASQAGLMQRQKTGLSSNGLASRATAKTSTQGADSRKNVVFKLWRFVAAQSLLVALVAGLICYTAFPEDLSLGMRVAVCLAEFVSLSVLIAAFNGLVSSTARLNTQKRLRHQERGNNGVNRMRRQQTLAKLRTGLSAAAMKRANSETISTDDNDGTSSTSDASSHSAGSSAGSVASTAELAELDVQNDVEFSARVQDRRSAMARLKTQIQNA